MNNCYYYQHTFLVAYIFNTCPLKMYLIQQVTLNQGIGEGERSSLFFFNWIHFCKPNCFLVFKTILYTFQEGKRLERKRAIELECVVLCPKGAVQPADVHSCMAQTITRLQHKYSKHFNYLHNNALAVNFSPGIYASLPEYYTCVICSTALDVLVYTFF